MKKTMLFFAILMALLLLAIVFIFHNSLLVSEASNAQSNEIAVILRQLFDPHNTISDSTFNALVRKIAHIIEFGILGCVLMAITIILADIKKQKVVTYIFAPMFFSLFIAVIDEYIQLFDGRTSSVKDVLINFCGSIAGIILICTIHTDRKKTRNGS